MIKIIDGWGFEVEEKQYTLIHEYQKEKGVFGKRSEASGEFVTKREEVGFFTNLSSMLRRLAQILCKEKVDEGEITTIGEYIAKLKELEDGLKEICGEE